MPVYEYQCRNRHRFELKQSFTAEPLATCPTCATEVERVIQPVSVHFKGSGFYVTDYGRTAGSINGGNAGSKAKSKPESKAEESKETSPATAGKASEGKEE